MPFFYIIPKTPYINSPNIMTSQSYPTYNSCCPKANASIWIKVLIKPSQTITINN